MPDRNDILWFKRQFAARIAAAVADTPLGVDLVVAIACQETGFIWSTLRRRRMSVARILALCVGDTIDARPDGSGRPFPKHRADLLSHPQGDAMFAIARQALVDMAAYIPGYERSAANPDKFCRGYGLFQRDLQFFRSDPHYFLSRRYARFDDTLAMCVAELKRGLRTLGLSNRKRLGDEALARVAIVYNTGRFRPERGLRQGHFDGQRYYGESVFAFLRLSKTVSIDDAPPALSPPRPGEAIVPPPTPPTATGPFFRVDTRSTTLRLRSQPQRSTPPIANVIADLPDGHPVRAITGRPAQGFLEIETTLLGAHLRGFASTAFLVRDECIRGIPVTTPAPTPPKRGIVAAHLPPPVGRVVRRSAFADAHSLDEPDRPARRGADVGALRDALAAIVDWLACDAREHLRYQPREGATFCNVYAHDYCHLAGVYLPRVWWTQAALLRIARGERVPVRIGATVREMRSNDLCQWLRDFGPDFGWRRTGSATSLQREANQGAVAMIAAERKQNGRPGHLAMVVPETARLSARRDAAGEVIAPLQSQAGSVNLRRGTGIAEWWKDAKYSNAAFWLHA